jgi:hypothetical protein
MVLFHLVSISVLLPAIPLLPIPEAEGAETHQTIPFACTLLCGFLRLCHRLFLHGTFRHAHTPSMVPPPGSIPTQAPSLPSPYYVQTHAPFTPGPTNRANSFSLPGTNHVLIRGESLNDTSRQQAYAQTIVDNTVASHAPIDDSEATSNTADDAPQDELLRQQPY